MGMGDEIMVTGEVKRHPAKKVVIWDPRKQGRARWHELWEGNQRIARPGEPFDARIINCGGTRPYIVDRGQYKWVWRQYRPEPGELFLTPAEEALSRLTAGAIIINPTIKESASVNKAWGGWASLIAEAPGFPWLQIGGDASLCLPGIPFLHTASFREACAALAGARAAVLHEGGLHHAAAALGVPAVVIYGGFISPQSTGYSLHRNIFDGSPEHPLGCGMRVFCRHCSEAMAAITPNRVLSELSSILDRR